MEVINAKKISVLVLLFGIVFLFLASRTFGQMGIERQLTYSSTYKKMVTSRSSTEALWFKIPNTKDTLIIGVGSDSLGLGVINLALYITFPKRINIDYMIITVGYIDGTKNDFKQIRMDADNYSEYEPVGDINQLATKKIAYVNFKDVGKFTTKDNNYFIDFFNML